MNPTNSGALDGDELAGLLRQAVVQARQQIPPAPAKQQALEAIARRITADAKTRSQWRTSRLVIAISSIAAVLLLAIVINVWHEHPAMISGIAEKPSSPKSIAMAPATSSTSPLAHVDDIEVTKGSIANRQYIFRPRTGDQPYGINPIPSAGTTASRNMAIAHDATVLVASGEDKPITLGEAVTNDTSKNFLQVWDWSKSKLSRPLKVSAPAALAVSPDGSKIVTADGHVIDSATGESAALPNFPPQASGLKFSPDGHTLLLQIVEKDSAVARLLEFPSGKRICEIPDYWRYTFAAAFSADNKQVALMRSDKFIHRFDAATGKELAKYEPAHTNSVRAIVISDDGKQIASCASSAGEIRLWDLPSGKLQREFLVKTKSYTDKEVNSLAFSHDGKLLAGGGIRNLVLWDAATGEVLHLYAPASADAAYLRFSPDDKSLTAVRPFSGTMDNKLTYPLVENYPVERAPKPK